MKIDERMETAYAEAVALMGDMKGIYGKAQIVTEALIDNLSMRLEWQAAENRRRNGAALTKGEPAPAPIATMAELEALGRIVATLQDPRLIEFRTGDPGAGAKEIVRILELARKEYGANEQTINNPEAKAEAEEAPEGVKKMDEGQGDKICQSPTVERPPATRHIGTCYGKVRRGSG